MGTLLRLLGSRSRMVACAGIALRPAGLPLEREEL